MRDAEFGTRNVDPQLDAPNAAPGTEYRVLPPRGRLIGVDVGTVRVGLAVCDPDRLVSSAVETYTRRTPEMDADRIRKLVADEKAVGFVVGLALMLDGREDAKAAECRRYGAWLTAVTGLPAAFADERFTSAAADDVLRDTQVHWKKRKGKQDRIAAQLILQTYIDAGCPPSL